MSRADQRQTYSDQRIAATKAELLSPAERAAFEAQFGQIVGPILDARLEAKARELMASQEARWRQVLRDVLGEEPERAARLVTREQAAELLGVSLSTVKRMEDAGELPEPIKFSERVVRHRLIDVEAVGRARNAA